MRVANSWADLLFDTQAFEAESGTDVVSPQYLTVGTIVDLREKFMRWLPDDQSMY